VITSFATIIAEAALMQAASAPAQPTVPKLSVWALIMKGGPVMIPIGACSLVALAIIFERVVSLRRSKIIPAAFLPGIKGLLSNGDFDRSATLDYCRSQDSPIARIFAVGIRRLGEPIELLEKHVEESGQREVAKLRKYLRALAAIASISTLLGLLGTILGLIEAFQTVAASGEALGKTELLAGGIYEAMVTTAAGLCVAIPVIIAHQALCARVERLVTEMDETTLEFIESYAERPAASPRESSKSLEPPLRAVATAG
jgi:biopolymer transport protein ExbB